MSALDRFLEWIDLELSSKVVRHFHGPVGAAVTILVVVALVVWFTTTL